MSDHRIILPGDPGWDSARAAEVAPPPEKLPNAVLEAAFSEVVNDVQDLVLEGKEILPSPEPVLVEPKSAVASVVQAIPPGPQPKISYKYHKPAQQESHDVKSPQPIKALLLEDLPRSWERKCYVGKVTYKDGKRVGGMAFRRGCVITITGYTLFPGIGNLYWFEEGACIGACVRQEQFQMLQENSHDELAKSDGAKRLPEAGEQVANFEGN